MGLFYKSCAWQRAAIFQTERKHGSPCFFVTKIHEL